MIYFMFDIIQMWITINVRGLSQQLEELSFLQNEINQNEPLQRDIYLGCVKQTGAFDNVQNAQIQIILHIHKVSSWPRSNKTFFMLNSAEHEIFHANKSQITNNAKFFLAKHNWAWKFLCW